MAEVSLLIKFIDQIPRRLLRQSKHTVAVNWHSVISHILNISFPWPFDRPQSGLFYLVFGIGGPTHSLVPHDI
jgi:hypothetical protein